MAEFVCDDVDIVTCLIMLSQSIWKFGSISASFLAFRVCNSYIVDIVTCLIMLSQSTGKCGRIFGYKPRFTGFVTSRKIKNIGQHAANINVI